MKFPFAVTKLDVPAMLDALESIEASFSHQTKITETINGVKKTHYDYWVDEEERELKEEFGSVYDQLTLADRREETDIVDFTLEVSLALSDWFVETVQDWIEDGAFDLETTRLMQQLQAAVNIERILVTERAKWS